VGRDYLETRQGRPDVVWIVAGKQLFKKAQGLPQKWSKIPLQNSSQHNDQKRPGAEFAVSLSPTAKRNTPSE
jgi:hypothetical protein